MASPSKLFYLTGLGILMKGVVFTPDERMLLEFLCKHAAVSDDQYLVAVRQVRKDARTERLIQQLIKTLRSLGKEPELRAHYDRAA